MPITTTSSWPASDANHARRGRHGCHHGRSSAHGRDRSRLDLLDELLAHLQQAVARQRRRFLKKINRARFERSKHLIARRTGDADDDDGDRTAEHLRPHKRHSIHLGHIQIARDDIGVSFQCQLERLATVSRCAHDLDKWTARQHLGHDLAHIGRVVDHQHPDE